MKRVLFGVLMLTLVASANEFRLASMGKAYFVFPDAETDMWLNPAYLAYQQQSVFHLATSFQRYGKQPYSGIRAMNYAAATLPDEVAYYDQWYQMQARSITVHQWGTLAVRLGYDRVTAPERRRYNGDIVAASIYPPPVLYTGNSLITEQWVPEVALSRKIGPDVYVGVRLIPMANVLVPNFYDLVPFGYSDTDIIQASRFQLAQAGLVTQLSPRVRLGFSMLWEHYRWSVPALGNDNWFYTNVAVNLLTDVRIKTHGNFRLWFRLQHPQLRAPAFQWYGVIPNYLQYQEVNPLTAVKTLALSYSLQLPALDFNVALVNDWGTVQQKVVTIDNTYIEGEIYKTYTPLEVINSYLTLGLRLQVHSALAVQSGFVLGGKGYERNGPFSSTRTRSLTRVPTIGLSWKPSATWEVNVNMLPEAGSNIVSSSLNGQNFYQLAVRYYPGAFK